MMPRRIRSPRVGERSAVATVLAKAAKVARARAKVRTSARAVAITLIALGAPWPSGPSAARWRRRGRRSCRSSDPADRHPCRRYRSGRGGGGHLPGGRLAGALHRTPVGSHCVRALAGLLCALACLLAPTVLLAALSHRLLQAPASRRGRVHPGRVSRCDAAAATPSSAAGPGAPWKCLPLACGAG